MIYNDWYIIKLVSIMGLYVKMILQSQLIILVNCEKKIYLPSITLKIKSKIWKLYAWTM